jgi:hypothetical protein
VLRLSRRAHSRRPADQLPRHYRRTTTDDRRQDGLMPSREPQSKLWFVTVLMAAVILYGSFYPFDFRIPANGIGPIGTFVASVSDRPGRGDFIANILLYLPFGFSSRRAALPGAGGGDCRSSCCAAQRCRCRWN